MKTDLAGKKYAVAGAFFSKRPGVLNEHIHLYQKQNETATGYNGTDKSGLSAGQGI